MPDNTALRSTIARQVKGVFNYQFTSSLTIAGRNVPNRACLSEISESDKLELAGRDILRAQNAAVLAIDLVGAKYEIGQKVTLDGDPNWEIKNYKVSPDGAVVTFLLMDAN
jgi:hypothetical protein